MIMRRAAILFRTICILAAVALSTLAQSPKQTTPESSPQVRQKTFEVVWSTIQKQYYDPTFGGLDWQAVHDRYAPQVTGVRSDAQLYELLTKMLGELHTSHLEIIQPEALAQMEAPPTTTGIGLRLIESQVVVFRTLPGSSAERAGLRPGYVVTKIDDEPVANVEEAFAKLGGLANTKTRVTYLDELDKQHEITLERETLQPELLDKEQVGKLSIYALFDSRRLTDGIGYIRFSAFIEALNKKIRAAIESMNDAPGLIIDLRGNGGGDDSVAIKMAGMLFDKKTQLMITRTRKGDDDYYQARPQKRAFLRTVVILVDEASGSASEQFAAGMQEIGRAVVIGKTTEGEDMDANIQKLPTGAYLVYAYGLPRTPKGIVIEGRGVIPDMDISLSRAELLKGNDSQLSAAVAYIQSHKK